jgi:hypothetical protein
MLAVPAALSILEPTASSTGIIHDSAEAPVPLCIKQLSPRANSFRVSSIRFVSQMVADAAVVSPFRDPPCFGGSYGPSATFV